MGEYISPWDFKTIFMDYFLGSPQLFAFALLLVISFSSAYFQMSNKNFALILLISSTVFAFYLGEALFFLVLIIVGFILFKIFAMLFR